MPDNKTIIALCFSTLTDPLLLKEALKKVVSHEPEKIIHCLPDPGLVHNDPAIAALNAVITDELQGKKVVSFCCQKTECSVDENKIKGMAHELSGKRSKVFFIGAYSQMEYKYYEKHTKDFATKKVVV